MARRASGFNGAGDRDPVAGLDEAAAQPPEGDEEGEERDLDDQEAAVGGVGQGGGAAHLPPSLERAGDQDDDHRPEGHPGEAGDDDPQLVGQPPGQDGHRQHDQAAQPQADRAQVDDVGHHRQRHEILG